MEGGNTFHVVIVILKGEIDSQNRKEELLASNIVGVKESSCTEREVKHREAHRNVSTVNKKSWKDYQKADIKAMPIVVVHSSTSRKRLR